MQNWSCMHLCGHSSVKFLWSCDARAQDSFSSILNQPNVSKICSFINLCIPPSPFRASGEISQHSPFRCRHIFQKSIMINEFFQRKVGSHLFSKACRFLARQLIFSFSTFFFLLAFFFFLICSLFLFTFFSFLFHFLSFSISFSFLFYFYFYHKCYILLCKCAVQQYT